MVQNISMDQQLEKIRHTRKSQEEIADLLKKFSESGSTVKQFCKEHQIVPGTFHKWRGRIKGKSSIKPDKAAFAQIQVTPPVSSLFAEVKGIRVYQPVSAAYLKELLA